jgi:hypothetical protein
MPMITFRIEHWGLALLLAGISVVAARAEQLPIASGAYVEKKSLCTDLRNGELDMIDFQLDENRRSFSTGENSCVVSSIKSLSASRLKVEADCDEFGELSQFGFFLDKLPSGDIRVNGDDLFFCSVEKGDQASKQSVSGLIEQWEELNENCRGGSGDNPDTIKACDQRAEFSERLGTLGYCYDGETNAASAWKTCE